MNRLVDPDRGTVRYRGRDVRDFDPLELRREVCLVPQLPALLPGTVADNVLYGVRLAGRDADVPAMLELAGLDSVLRRPRFRSAVGRRAAARDAGPRAGARAGCPAAGRADLGARRGARGQPSRRRCARLQHEVSASFVLVTHDLDQAARLASWVVRLEQGGRLVGQGPVGELLRR